MIGLGQPPVRTATLAGGTRLLDHHQLVLIMAGRGTHTIDFVPYGCRPGTVLWARAGQAVRPGGQPGLDAVVVAVDASDLPVVPDWLADPFGPVCWQLAGEDEDAVIDGVSQLVVDARRHGDATDLLRHQIAVLVLRLALVPPAGPPPGDGADLFRRFRGAVESGYADCRQVTAYAETLGCSVRTLTRACLAATGRGAKQVLDDRVVLQAKRLLAATDVPVAAIGQRLGFAEPTHFCRLFHRATGHSPGEFRGRRTS